MIPFKDRPPMTYFLQLGSAFLFLPSNNATILGLNQGVNPVVGAELLPSSLVTKIDSTNRGPGFNTQAFGEDTSYPGSNNFYSFTNHSVHDIPRKPQKVD